jgi:hypothetical protein
MMEHNGDDARIGDDETVLRRVHGNSVVFNENTRRFRPSTQAFLQDGPDGLVSVYLSSETTPTAVAAGGPERYLASIKVGFLRKVELGIVRDPTSGGPGHCVITGRKTKGTLNRIVQNAEWVEGYAPQ